MPCITAPSNCTLLTFTNLGGWWGDVTITERRAAPPRRVAHARRPGGGFKASEVYWVIVTVAVLGLVALRAMVPNRPGG